MNMIHEPLRRGPSDHGSAGRRRACTILLIALLPAAACERARLLMPTPNLYLRGGVGHGYFHASPAVSSDLILLLRDDLDPGADHGRPLVQKAQNFWELADDYPVFEGK